MTGTEEEQNAKVRDLILTLAEDFGIDGPATILYISKKLVDDSPAYIAVDDVLKYLGKKKGKNGKYRKDDIKRAREIIERIIELTGFNGARIR
jgi:hypothetical protein